MIDGLETPRLSLRPITSDDLHLLLELDADVEVMRYITGRASSVAEVRAEVADALGRRWLVFDRTSGDFLGWVAAIPTTDGAEYDIGWRFRRSAWGQGFATEAGRALVDALFERGAARVYAQTMATNERSRSVMHRIGLHYVRTFHLHFDDPLPGTELGEVEYELRRSDWELQR